MSTRRANACALVALMLASALPVRSQGKPSGSVVFSVADKKGQPIGELKAADVKLREDGKDQAVAGVRNLTATPLSIALLVDTGASTLTLPNYWQAEALAFFASALRKGVDKGAVFHFRSGITKTQDYTDDMASLSAAVKQTGSAGASALFNGLSLVTETFGNSAARRVIVLIADGEDTGSATTADAAAQKLRDNGVVVFPIVVKSDRVLPADNKGEFFVKRLAEESGGIVFNTTSAKEAREVFKTIQDLLSTQFELQYQPVAAIDGKFHKLRIEVTDKNLKVRHPSGYYAKP